MVQTARAVVSNTGNKVQTLGPLKNKSGKKAIFFPHRETEKPKSFAYRIFIQHKNSNNLN
jgi:hypothetical protein